MFCFEGSQALLSFLQTNFPVKPWCMVQGIPLYIPLGILCFALVELNRTE